MADPRRRVWLGLTIALTGGAFAITVALAPPASARAGTALGWIMFTGSSAHVASTGWLFTVRGVRDYARRCRVRFLWLPAILVISVALLAAALAPGRFAWLLLPYFGWQFWHFQKQNLGMAALTAASSGVRGLSQGERRLLLGAGVAGTGGLLVHPALLQVTVDAHLGALFPVCAAAYAVITGLGVLRLLARPASSRPAGFCAVYLIALGFFAPVFLFRSPYAAVGGLTVAHGMQYLLLLTCIAGGPGPTRIIQLAVLGNVALIGGAVLSVFSHLHDGSPVGRALFGCYLGVVMAHFVIDAGIWRLRDPFPRAFLAAHVPYLVRRLSWRTNLGNRVNLSWSSGRTSSMRDDGFTQFVQARADYHLRLATLLAGDWHAGEDLLQASLVKLYQAWSRVDITTADAYLHKIMANTHRSWWRARWRRELPAGDLPELAGGDFAAQHAVGAAVRAALAALPRQQRAVLVLRYWADLPEAEVADILGCAVGSVKTHAHRGIRALRQRLGQPDAVVPAYQGQATSTSGRDSDDR